MKQETADVFDMGGGNFNQFILGFWQ